MGFDKPVKMSDHEQIAQVAHQKWANEWIACFLSESFIRSFLGKKRAIRSENRWANSQPWDGVGDISPKEGVDKQNSLIL